MIQCDIYNASYIYNDVLTFTTMQNDIYSDVVIVTVACGYLQRCGGIIRRTKRPPPLRPGQPCLCDVTPPSVVLRAPGERRAEAVLPLL